MVTGRRWGAGRVLTDGTSRWVTAGYLDEKKPKPEPPDRRPRSRPTAASAAGCTNGTSVSGQPNIVGVHQAVCAAFPEITSYGTYRSDGEHAQGMPWTS